MNGSKHISNCYSALQGLYWMSYGAIYTFAAVFLLDRKFTDSQVGTLIAPVSYTHLTLPTNSLV